MFHKILLCFDGSQCALEAAAIALQLAASNEARVEILSVIPVPQYAAGIGWADRDFERGHSYFMARQQEVVREAAEKGIQVDSRIVAGNVARTIVWCARNSGVDLIVLGHRGSSTPWEQTDDAPSGNLGSIADQVAEHAHCCVLVVR